MVSVFTYAHVKWFYGQSERTYYLKYFIMNNVKDIQSKKNKMEWNKIFKHFELDEIVITFTERSLARVIVA